MIKIPIDDYIEATKVYLPPSRLAEILQEHCNYPLLMQDYDRIFNKYDNFMDRLKKLDDNFRSGKYTLGLEPKTKKRKKKNDKTKKY